MYNINENYVIQINTFYNIDEIIQYKWKRSNIAT